ncbi:phosphoribosylglycinamide formyltransferase [Spiribacter sp. 2438]|uniref:phosphoribosylglycinamide formyltransferase n=1 Tax=Spiribacter sp. 2438 TaxID=2666185 RepID=UPI0012B074A0|nr:phosphoribosylglycinamide formyltransferase [Spiribacter sp. 2438]QGM21249.1 phosphoribosylglycinamide formyltransferase [Spiribacter sp. 2438]
MTRADLRIAVLISGSGSNLQALLDAIAGGEIAGRIVRVISNRAEAGGLERARRAGVETEVLPHGDYPDRETYDAALAARLNTVSPDLVVLAGFMRILSDGFVEAFQGRLVNIHPSLLPAYRGLHTHARALQAGDREHGCSVHYVIPALDAGPVIAQASLPVHETDTPESLETRVRTLEHRLYPLVVRWIADGRVAMRAGRVCLDGEPLSRPPCITAGTP